MNPIRRSSKLLLCFIGLTFFSIVWNQALAEDVLPVFSKKWIVYDPMYQPNPLGFNPAVPYIDPIFPSPSLNYTDATGTEDWSYGYSITDTTDSTIESSLDLEKNWIFQDSGLISPDIPSYQLPITFAPLTVSSLNDGGIPFIKLFPGLFPGTSAAYMQIQKNGEPADILQWQEDFMLKDGNGVYGFYCPTDFLWVCSLSLVTLPIYTCPLNTRMNLSTGNCSTTPLVANADIVGRDLATNSKIVGPLGHVGLTSYTDLKDNSTLGDYVLQVMNDPGNVVQEVTLGNFEHAADPTGGKYWGEVYGLPGIDPQSEAADANAALQAGWNQRNYNPTYTPGFIYQEGGLSTLSMIDPSGSPIQQLGVTQAMFRCDTFVDFSYLQGYGVHLPLQPAPVIGPPPFLIPSPITTYNSFQNQRTDVPPQPADPTLSSAPKLSAVQRDALGFTPDLSNAQTAELDKTVQAVLNNQALSTEAKNNNLWSMAEQNQADTAKFAYFVDTLSLNQRACNLVSQYVNAYSAQTSIANKRDLIAAIANGCLRTGALSSMALSSTEVASVLQAQTFIKQTLESETNPVLIKQALFGASEILPANPENYALISQAISRVNQGNVNLSDPDSGSLSLIQIAFVFANLDLQKAALPALLEANQSDQSANNFNQSLLLVLKTLRPEAITDSIKPVLLNYLQEQKSEHPEIASFQTQEGIDLLMAEATLNSKDQTSKNQYILNIVLNANPTDQALLIGQLDPSVFANTPVETLKKLQTGLQEPMMPIGALGAMNQNSPQESPLVREMRGVAISKLYLLIHQI